MFQKYSVKSLLSIFILFLIIYNIYLSANFVLHNDIGFNTDLARDFLLLQDVQQTHKLPLIGPRSGGISGIFHGPLWVYINLPAFLVSRGNPIGVGWFWIVLIFLLIAICYYVGRKLYGNDIGLLSALLISCLSIPFAAMLFNPFGAVLLSPLFFYFFYKYLEKNMYKYLLIALFLLGLIIQFQVALGGPLLVLTFLYLLFVLIKKKKLSHFSAFLILLIPLSTYILFDLRHDFLQTKALLSYLSGHGSEVKNFTFADLLKNRYDGFINGLVAVSYPAFYITYSIGAFFLYLFYKLIKTKKTKKDTFIFLFFYFYIGFWVLSFFFKGVVWGYYYWPFLPVVAIIIASGLKHLHKYLFVAFYLLIYITAFNFGQSYVNGYAKSYIGNDSGSWLFNYKVAQLVFNQHDKSFGYYIFSPDEYGYSPRYAMDYVAKSHTDVKVSPYKKEHITYLIISPPGGANNGLNGGWWKEHRVKIQNKPIKTWVLKNGFKVEKYILSDKEMQIPSDPNLIQSILFR